MTFVKSVLPSKAATPIDLTEFGIIISVIFERRAKLLGNVCTSSPIIIEVRPKDVMLPVEEQSLAFQTNSFKPVQLPNAVLPIDETEKGIVMDVKPLHPQKAYEPIDVTEFGIVIDAKPLSPLHRFSGIRSTLLPKMKDVIPVKEPNGPDA